MTYTPLTQRDWCQRITCALLLVAGLALASSSKPANASVLQLVEAAVLPGGGGAGVSDSDEVFVPTSADVTRNIFAGVGARTGGPGFFGASSAGVFGQVGMEARLFAVPPGSSLRTEVLIGSDEFINVSGFSGTVRSNFIIDGGFMRDLFSTNTTITFMLEVGAQNLGPVGPETGRLAFESASRTTASFGGAGGFFPGFEGGRYTASYSADAAGTGSFNAVAEGGLDLGATYDAAAGNIDIPFSLQSLDLGQLTPGDRLLIAYRAEFLITQNGISEGIALGFSDPFNLSDNPLLSSLRFTPTASVPLPGTLALMVLGAACAWRSRRGRARLPTSEHSSARGNAVPRP